MQGLSANLRTYLDNLYGGFDFRERARRDPIKFPKRYSRREDAEVAAFISSALSYGRVELFMPVIEKILAAMGESPHAFLLKFRAKKHGRLFENISYRFQSTGDILCLLHILGETLRKHSSLEDLFMGHFNEGATDIGHALAGMVNEMLNVKKDVECEKKTGSRAPRGLVHMLPSPLDGSACKRLNLFLRWVVRDRDLDLGIWRSVPKNKLVIPLDTHIMAVSRQLGLTDKKTANWRTAVEITGALKIADLEDPLKYDFPLCHSGMARIRQGKQSN
jgi:uncharacterized protein (TIGR02757 family)